MLLIAVGDSWFDFPGHDVVSLLEREHGYQVESIAHRGDTLEEMAQEDHQSDGQSKLARVFHRCFLLGRKPAAVIVSAGGNDLTSHTLTSMLRHRKLGLALRESVVAGTIDEGVCENYSSLLYGITGLCRYFWKESIPILVHGYGYVVPDGRGYLGGGWALPGPWLRPSFHRKGRIDLSYNTATMRALVDRLNDVLAGMSSKPGLEHVRYIDLRTTLACDVHHQMWSDELHPTPQGFALVAARFAETLSGATE